MTNILDIITIMQDMNLSVSSIRTAPNKFTEYPTGKIARGDLPIALTFPDEAQWDHHAMGGCIRERRTYTVQVLVTDTNTGLGKEHLQTISEIIDEIMLLYLDNTNTLNSETNVNIVFDAPTNDTGYMENMLYVDEFYHGFEFAVIVEIINKQRGA